MKKKENDQRETKRFHLDDPVAEGNRTRCLGRFSLIPQFLIEEEREEDEWALDMLVQSNLMDL